MEVPNVPVEVPLAAPEASNELKDTLINSFVANAKGREIEVIFAFDTTVSMSKYIAEVRKKLTDTCSKLMKDIPSIRIGIIGFGDYCSTNYVVSSLDLSNNVDRIVKYVDGVEPTLGGDYPEAYELALKEANKMSWTAGDHVNKALVIIGDSYPHPPSYTTEKINWRDELTNLVRKGVKVYGVLCKEEGTKAEWFMRDAAELSNGVFLTLKHLPLVTDMFLAVCYREFGVEHLATYRTEVEQEGRMEITMQHLFNQLETAPVIDSKIGKRSTESWYLISNDIGNAKFTWDSTTSNWKGYTSTNSSSTVTSTNTTAYTVTNVPTPTVPKKKEDKKKKSATGNKANNKEKKKKETKQKKITKKETKVEKTKKRKAEKEAEEEESPKKLQKGVSVIVGTGEWKRDRHGRMASL